MNVHKDLTYEINLELGQNWRGLGPYLLLGDLKLHTNMCMDATALSSLQAAKTALASCSPGNPGFYDSCGYYALLVSPSFSDQTDFGRTYLTQRLYSFSSFPSTFGVTLTGNCFYIGGWYSVSTLQSTYAPLVAFVKAISGDYIKLQAQATSATGPVNVGVFWQYTVAAVATAASVSATCAALVSGFVYLLLLVSEDSLGTTTFNVCCQDNTACTSSPPIPTTGMVAAYTDADTLTIYPNYKLYNLELYTFAINTAPVPAFPSAAFFTSVQASPPLTAAGPNCVIGSAPVCTACQSGYYLYQNRCTQCNPACYSCTGKGPNSCLTCNSGYYCQPSHPSICLPQCPTGYSLSGQTCVVAGSTVTEVDFTEYTARSFTLPNGFTVSHGFYDWYQPYPVSQRGVFFSQSGVINLPNTDTNPGQLVLNTDFAYDVWVLPYSDGNLFSVSTLVNSNSVFSMLEFGIFYQIDGLYPLFLHMCTYQRSGVTSSRTSNLLISPLKTQWYHLGFTISYDDVSQTTSVSIIVNTRVSTTLTYDSFFQDVPTSTHSIGSSSGFSSPLTGYIYKFRIQNAPTSVTGLISAQGTCPGCSACPASLGTCLSTCSPNQYIDGSGNCQSCMEGCTSGCVTGNSCSLCVDQLCSACNQVAGTCSQCFSGASVVNGKCACPSGQVLLGSACADQCGDSFYANNGICTSCSRGCVSCEGSQCFTCKDQFMRVDGQCTCGPNWLILSDMTCGQCDSSCKECAGSPKNCTSCYTEDGYYLSISTCLDCRDQRGYNGSLGVSGSQLTGVVETNINLVCKEICGDGLMMEQYACDDGNLVDGDGCSHLCQVENGWTCSNIGQGASTCIDTTHPTPLLQYLNVTSSGYLLLFGFSETIIFSQPVQVAVAVSSCDLFTFDLTPIARPPGGIYSTYSLTLTLYQSVAAGTMLTVTVLNSASITDTGGASLASDTVSTPLLDTFYPIQTQYLDLCVNSFSGIILAMVIFVFLASVMASEPLTQLWAFLESLQIISVLLYSAQKLPDNLRHFLRAFNFANFGFVPIFLGQGDANVYQQTLDPFDRENMHSDFLENIGSVFTIWCSLLGCFLVIRLLSRLFPSNDKLKILKDAFIFSVFLRFSIESCLQTSLSVSLQMSDLNLGTARSICNFLSLLLACVVLAFLFYLLAGKVMNKSASDLKLLSYRTRYGSLYDGLKLSTRVSQSFLLLQLLRRLLVTSILVGLKNSEFIQAIMMIVFSGGYCIGLIFLRPFRYRWSGNATQIVSSLLLFAALGLFLGLALDGYSFSVRNYIGWAALASFTCLICLNLGMMVWCTVQRIVSKLTKAYQAYAIEVLQSMKVKVPATKGQLDTTVVPTEVDELNPSERLRVKKALQL